MAANPKTNPSSTKSSKVKNQKTFSIIGIGTSAGGLETLKAFFDEVPEDCVHSFVVVQHLSPDYKSLMAELLSKNSALPILEVKNKMEVESGTVYLIPPKKNMTLRDGHLILSNKPSGRELNLPIDILFSSLARECQEKSIGIILSGTGSDGTSGAGAIKEAGGMVMVQSPVQAKFDGMPQSAINTGLIDIVAPVEELPGELLDFIEHPKLSGSLEEKISRNEDVLVKILNHVHNLTSMDFEDYKRPTLIRRVARRIGVNKLNSLAEYKDFIYENPSESHVLAREFLIGVTSFFRDTDVWDLLMEDIIPQLVEGKTKGEIIKVWCVGVSTGQEAYSLAILLNEELQRQGKSNTIKIFATDIEKTHLDIGSKGVYTESMIANISEKRRDANFIRKGDDYQIREHIRRMVIFSQHNILKDPPFNKMDISICRNLLIYMRQSAQKKVLDVLQYSLKLNAILILGSSESVGDHRKMLLEVNRKLKIYKNAQVSKTLGADPMNSPDITLKSAEPSLNLQRKLMESKLSEAMSSSLAEELDVAAVFFDDTFKIVNAYGEFGKYVSLPERGFSISILRMLPEHVASIVSRSVKKIKKNGEEKIRCQHVNLNKDGSNLIANLSISSFSLNPSDEDVLYLLVFAPQDVDQANVPALELTNYSSNDLHVAELEAELKETKQDLRDLVQEIETSNEELQATNEELLASNEELQSTNEELQSVNEELHTVNAELQQKVEDLASINADMDNLLKSTDIGTIFLDRKMRIRKFTPKLRDYFNLLESDIQRPLNHFTSNFSNSDLNILKIAKEALTTGKHIQNEVQDNDGNWFLLKTIPFYNTNLTIDGVVLSFVDINELKEVEKALRASEVEFRSLYDNAPDMFLSIDFKGNIINCNNKLIETLGYDKKEDLIGTSRAEIIDSKFVAQSIKDLELVKEKGEIINSFRLIKTKSGNRIPVRLNAAMVLNERGDPSYILCSWRDITALHNAEQKYIAQNKAFEQVLEGTMAGYFDRNIKENTEYLSPTFKKMFGYEDHEMENTPESWQRIIHPDDLPAVLENFNIHLDSKGDVPFDNQVRYYHKDGSIVWVWSKGKVIEWDSKGNGIRMVGSHVNITSLKNYEDKLKESNQQLERFAYVASHDLQEPLRTINDFISLLKNENIDALNEDSKTYIDFIMQASNRMGALVKSILAYSKIGQTGDFEKVDLNEVIKDVLNDLRLRIEEQNAVLHIDKMPIVPGDKMELHSLFLNLIGNAIKFVALNKAPEIVLKVTEHRGIVLFELKDNGIGIPKEHQTKIFEVFKRLHNSEDYEGTGIGLAHCKKIISLHKGEIWVSSEPGKGSTFSFTINTK
ncbi:chemotaxis protein CheB [Maribacter sp. 2210JD10-5]|uniref:chemotaxis protein CheB n=1 Tax=Maribacter sp. 2210JD10-5 TaxID=3386272 RepID=UPI0039BD87BA